jgi:hypothetical protein
MAEALSQNLKLIGRYSILRELRRDRYTVVYLAFDPVLNRELILKAVQLRSPDGQESRGHDRVEQAFMRQAQAAGRLHHPHIVTVFDAGRFRNIGYLALERVEGKLLDEAMVEGYRPGFLQAADIAARVADAVEYAHSRGVPHGHLGPSLIYLQGEDRIPRVMGFGGWIDSGATGDFELTGTQSMLPYFQNELGKDARLKDVRALGALLFLLLTGTRPDVKALRTRRGGSESPILDMRPGAPLALAEIADSALELRNLRPFGSAAQLRNALTTFLWGNRGTQPLPNAATITGMPARLEVIAPQAPPSVAVPTVQQPAAAGRQRGGNLLRIAIGATAMAGIALIGVAWLAVQGRGAPSSAMARTQADGSAATAPTPSPADAVAVDTAPERTAQQTTHFGPAATKAARPPVQPAPAQGVVAFAVAPWGEVYVDGKARGTTPPLAQLLLPAGRHTIELRNGERVPYIAQIEVAPDRPQQIVYRFQ